MAEYRTRFTYNQKRHKLATFNSVYYEGNPNNWKVSRLPNWMQFYGNSLEMELNGELPTYYRRFTQGTVVMIDYGVPVGNELGGHHFGIIISNNDTKYKRKVVVVPLSSKYHRGYIDLGYDLLEGIRNLIRKRIAELQNKNKNLYNRQLDFQKNNEQKQFAFSEKDIQFLEANNIDLSLISSQNILIDLTTKNKELENLIQKIKNTDAWEKYENIFEFVSFTETMFNFQDSLLEEQKSWAKNVQQLQNLQMKLQKYNKRSYAVISDIKSISKLKVSKLTPYTISGNTQISQAALQKLKNALIKTIE